MACKSVVGMGVYCRRCHKPFRLGSLNARQLGLEQVAHEFRGIDEIGWICRCDHCGCETKYYRLEFVSEPELISIEKLRSRESAVRHKPRQAG
jgi:hypothetical protein